MGENKPTTRTLPSGEKVTHYPDGRMVRQSGPSNPSALATWFDEAEDTHQWLNAEKQYQSLQEVEKLAISMDEGDSVPTDKRPI